MDESISLLPTGEVQSPPSASKLFGETFSFYKAHWRFIAGVGGVPFLLSTAATLLGDYSISAVFGILSFIASILMLTAFLVVIKENGHPEGGVKGAYRKGAALFFSYAWVVLLQNLVTVGGFFAVIIPAIIFSVLLSLSTYTYLFEGDRGIEALIKSWHYVKGYWWPVCWRFIFLMVVLLFVNFLVLGVTALGLGINTADFPRALSSPEVMSQFGLHVTRFYEIVSGFFSNFFLVPFSLIYGFIMYHALQQIKTAPLAEEEKKRIKKILSIFVVVGIVGLIIFLVVAGAGLVYFLNKAGVPPAFFQGSSPSSLDFSSVQNSLKHLFHQ